MSSDCRFPSLSDGVPTQDFTPSCLSCDREGSSELSEPPSPTLSDTLRNLGNIQSSTERNHLQQITPASSQCFDVPSPSETLKERFAGQEALIDAMCQKLDETFPWVDFAAEHSVDPEQLRNWFNETILLPICSQSPGHLQELCRRAENYRIIRDAISEHMSTKDLQEARELRDYEKLRAKEIWRARKSQFKRELEELGAGWRGSRQKLTAVREKLKMGFRVEKLRRQEEKVASKSAWKKRQARIAEAVAGTLPLLSTGTSSTQAHLEGNCSATAST